MKTSNPVVKNLIMDILILEDGVDAEGKRKRRATFPTALLKVKNDIVKKITNQLECDVKNGDTITTMLDKDYTPEAGEKVFLRYNSEEVEFTEQEIKAIRTFYGMRTEVIDLSNEALDEFNELIKK